LLDLAFFGFFAGLFLIGFKRPFVWILAYICVDIVAPQKISWGILNIIPISLLTFIAAFAGWLLFDNKKDARFTYRQFLMLLLLIYCGYTTMGSAFPESAMFKWGWVWKAFLFAIFLPLALRTKLRIETTLLVMVLSVGAIVISGGIKTILGGGGYGQLRLLVDNNTGLYEGSIISTVAISIIPLVLYLVKHNTIFPEDWRVKLFAAGLIFACCLMPIGTTARTGLVCLAVLAILLLRSTRRRFLYLALIGAAGAMTVPFLPQTYLDRMSTIRDHESDTSASTRIAVWMWTLDYVKKHPMGGGFDAYKANDLRFKTTVTEQVGGATVVTQKVVEDESRAYHSSYFELLGEQGYPGFMMWAWLHLAGLWQMEVLRRRWKKRTGAGEQWQAPLANALQQCQIVYLAGAAFVGIGYQPFALLIVAVQCGLWSYLKRLDQEAAEQRRKAPAKQELRPAGVLAH
jgi:probable O-glycosylation ligase (exosortase A-associated)